MSNDPLRQRLAHSFRRAARGRRRVFFKAAAAVADGKRGHHAALSGRSRCTRTRGRPRHLAASRTSSSSSDFGESSALAVLLLEMASTVAQDGQAAGTEARKGRARPARVGGPFMAFMYRFFRTFCNHVRAASCDVLVCCMDMRDRVWLSVSDNLRPRAVPWMCGASRGAHARTRAAARRPSGFIAKAACT